MLARLFAFSSRIRGVFTSRRLDEDFDREIESHLDMLTADYVRRGMALDASRRAARLRFGGATQIREQQRDQRGLPLVETALQDIRYALRTLRREPAFSAVAVFTLAIGIGATTAMFSVANAVLLRPLPYQDPDRLIEVTETNPLKSWTHTVVAPANFADWQKLNTVFSGMAAYNGVDGKGASNFSLFFTGGAEPQQIKGLAVSGNLLRVLGVSPLLGRDFTDQETFEGPDRVAILGYGLWQSLFAGDPSVVGRTISLSGRNYSVVGVMPRAFFFPGRDVQLWVPLGYKPGIFVEMRRPHWLHVIARLRPGVSLEQARAQMTAVAAQLERQYPDTNTRMGVRLEEFHAILASESRPALTMLLGAVGVLFLIVCANIANLQLGRAVGRTREMAIRGALGAARARLVRQVLTEALVLSAFGGACGLVLAMAARTTLVRFAPAAVPIFADVRLDRSVLIFTLVITIVAPIVFGLIPALTASRAERLTERTESASRQTRSLRDVLVTCEVGLSVVLVVGALLLVRSLVRLQQVDPGFDPEHVVSFRVTLPNVRYQKSEDQVRAFADIERRLRAMPGVEAVGATSTLALRGYTWTGDATVEGRGGDDYERELRHEAITPDYFRAMGIPLIAGRMLDARDGKDQRVTLVNEALAAKYFRGVDPIGKRIKFGRPKDKDEEWITIVGIVGNEKQEAMDRPVQPEVYVAVERNPQNPLTFVVRGSLDTGSTVAAARQEVHAVDKDLALTDITTLRELVDHSMNNERFRTILLSGFAGVALFLAALGLYGVLAYFVVQRSRELGIRLALGAQPTALFRLVVRQGMRPVVIGSVAGLIGAAAATGLMRSLLFGIDPIDPPTYLATAATLAAVALMACATPALRATQLDPLVALREE
jgi:predicted permease